MREKRGSIWLEQYRAFIDSFSLNKKFWFSYLFDLIFYFFVIIAFISWGSLLKRKAESLAGIDYNAMFTGTPQQMDATLNILQSFLAYLLISLIVLVLVVIFLFSIFKGVIWTSLTDKKRDFRYFRNLFFTNLLFYTPLLLILAFCLWKNLSIVALVVFLLVLHFNALSIYFLTSGEKLWGSLKSAFKSGFRIHRFLLFYIIFAVLFLVLDQGFGLIRGNFSSNSSAGITILVLLVLFLSVVRNGFIKLADKIR